MIRSALCRLYPGALLRAQLRSQAASANRHFWNWATGLNPDAMKAYREGTREKPSFTFFSRGLGVTSLRNREGHEGLKEWPFAGSTARDEEAVCEYDEAGGAGKARSSTAEVPGRWRLVHDSARGEDSDQRPMTRLFCG